MRVINFAKPLDAMELNLDSKASRLENDSTFPDFQ
jgi:hypothetical protein